ncbi:MAG: hypothetical protein FWD40_00230 [Treponema sp.]|nr:hypothetical protein [Treponema sp.]
MNEAFDAKEFLIEKIWSVILERQGSIKKQLDEIDKKYNRQLEENNRIIEKSEETVYRRIGAKNLELQEIDTRILKQLEENKVKLSEEENDEKNNEKRSKKSKRKNSDFSFKAGHHVFSAIIMFFNEHGYNFDDETLRRYWELVTAITANSDENP